MQQGYVFGCVGLCMYVYVYVCIYVGIYVHKKRAVWGRTTEKSFVTVIYCSLLEFNSQKGVTTPGDSFREKILTILLK